MLLLRLHEHRGSVQRARAISGADADPPPLPPSPPPGAGRFLFRPVAISAAPGLDQCIPSPAHAPRMGVCCCGLFRKWFIAWLLKPTKKTMFCKCSIHVAFCSPQKSHVPKNVAFYSHKKPCSKKVAFNSQKKPCSKKHGIL